MADKPYVSRKHRMTWGVLILATLGFILTGIFPSLVASYAAYIGALALLSGLYQGANVADQHVANLAKKDSDPGAP